eukprot:TRINITY_DN6992_c1_g1_i1.p1 TRINITY_DN6992_c1_g1~~TRINITY_DN6992_c1_g1_i1.p1  ORF type:complete len:687 (-),score=129.71 TRINITY_DN6992_c1_g1_i1:194-2254(-)
MGGGASTNNTDWKGFVKPRFHLPSKQGAKDGSFVLLDPSNSEFYGLHEEYCWDRRGWPGVPEEYRGEGHALLVGRVTDVIEAPETNNWEYTVKIEERQTMCITEEHLLPLRLSGVPFVSEDTRRVAVQLKTHGFKRFGADIVRRNEDGTFEIKFIHDKSKLDGVSKEILFVPDADTIYTDSPETMPPDDTWLLDQKIQMNIDEEWPMCERIVHAVEQLSSMRRAVVQPPLMGPFVGKNAQDSEGFPAHPAPPPELGVSAQFVDAWSKFAGKIKFATTHDIGTQFPRYDAWVEAVDAGEPLYFHAALPVYAGLICIGHYPFDGPNSQAEWIRPCDVGLVGVAVYVDGELFKCTLDPPYDDVGSAAHEKYQHACCNYVPGCASTYRIETDWVGGVFCLAPMEGDYEVRDDIFTIEAYHEILKSWPARQRQGGGNRQMTITVNLVLSTNFCANLRQVCAGSVRILMSEKGLMAANVRLRDVLENRLEHAKAYRVKRPRKPPLSKPDDKRAEIELENRARMIETFTNPTKAVEEAKSKGVNLPPELAMLLARGNAQPPVPGFAPVELPEPLRPKIYRGPPPAPPPAAPARSGAAAKIWDDDDTPTPAAGAQAGALALAEAGAPAGAQAGVVVQPLVAPLGALPQLGPPGQARPPPAPPVGGQAPPYAQGSPDRGVPFRIQQPPQPPAGQG